MSFRAAYYTQKDLLVHPNFGFFFFLAFQHDIGVKGGPLSTLADAFT
jgi:hypothetical protein